LDVNDARREGRVRELARVKNAVGVNEKDANRNETENSIFNALISRYGT
jgi:hypothetical protein